MYFIEIRRIEGRTSMKFIKEMGQKITEKTGDKNATSHIVQFQCQFKEVTCTANKFNAKDTGFLCVRVPTVLSLYFLQLQNVCSDPL